MARHHTAALVVAGTALVALAGASAFGADQRTVNGLTGPANAVGISIDDLAVIDLSKEFPGVDGIADRRMRARYVKVAPGGIVPIHSHENRPAYSYVISGEIYEYRSDTEGGQLRRPGDLTIDNGGLAQWWKNESDQEVVIFVVDMFQTTVPAGH